MATRPETPRAQADKIARDAAPKTSELVGVDGWPDRKGVTTRIQQAVDKAYPGWTITLRVESRTPTRVVLIIDARNSAVPPPLLSAAQVEKLARLIDDTLEALVPRWDFTVTVASNEPGHVALRVVGDKGREGDPPVSADGSLLFDSNTPTFSNVTVVRLNQGEKPYGRWLFVHFLDDHVPKSQINTRPGLLQLATLASTSPSQPGSTITVISYAWANAPSTANITSMGPNNTPVTQQLTLASGQTYAIWLPLIPQYAYLNPAGLGPCRIWW